MFYPHHRPIAPQHIATPQRPPIRQPQLPRRRPQLPPQPPVRLRHRLHARRMKTEDGRRPIHIHPTVPPAVSVSMERLPRATTKARHFSLPVNRTEQASGDLARVQHEIRTMQLILSLRPDSSHDASMSKSRTLSTSLIGALVLTIATASARSAEPKYQGRSLTMWLSAYRDAGVDTAEEKRAAEAVRGIGTNAIPYLLRMLTNRDLDLQMDAQNGFIILGQIAAPAVPALAALLKGTNELSMFTAARSLGGIGAPALPVLMETLTNRHFKVATQAYLAIGALGTNAKPAIPILLRDLQHPNHFYRERAADTLGSLHIEPETVVPALTNLLTDSSLAARHLAIQSLGQFGSAARSAVPAISTFLTDADLSYTATEALRQIAPEVLVNRSLQPEKSQQSLSDLLNSPDPNVRSAATNFMQRYGLGQTPSTPTH